MIYVIEPIGRAIIDNLAHSLEGVREKLFGGFCECSGWMFQKFWLNLEEMKILISECEKCWKNYAYYFNSTKFIKRDEVRLVTKSEIVDYLKSILTELEVEALIKRAQNKPYKPQDLARAKKKLLEMNLPFESFEELLK